VTLPFQISQRRTALCRDKLVWSIWVIPCLGASMGWQLMMVCVSSLELIPTEGMVVRWWFSFSHFGGICYFEGITLLSQKPDLKENTLPEMEKPMMSVSSLCNKLHAPRPFPQVMGKSLKKTWGSAWGDCCLQKGTPFRKCFQYGIPILLTCKQRHPEMTRATKKSKHTYPIPLNPSCLMTQFPSLAIRVLYSEG